jgi:hypothetical protein
LIVDQPSAMATSGQIFGEKHIAGLDSLRRAFAVFEQEHTA